MAVLDEVGAMLQAYPTLALDIEGHTDSEGAAENNQTLSERRAAAVRAYLIDAHGVAPTRLNSRGYGESRPIASNETATGRQENRRVEIVRAASSPGSGTSAAPSIASAAPAMENAASSMESTAMGTCFDDGEMTIHWGGQSLTLPADGGWDVWQNADDPMWLQFRAEAGSSWRQGVPGFGIFASYDVRTSSPLAQRQLWNNALTGSQLDTYSEHSGEGHKPSVEITRWEDVGDDVRAIEGRFEVVLEDGSPMTGSFRLRLPRL